MEYPFLARYICLETHNKYSQGQMYTIAEHGMEDYGFDTRSYKIKGELIDVAKFHRVHDKVQQTDLTGKYR